MTDNKITDVMLDEKPIDVSKEVDLVWSIANKLRGPYSRDKYKDVIIPMTVIRRFECALAKTKDAVVERFTKDPQTPIKAMCRIAGYQFYNTSRFDLKELCNDYKNIVENFKSYLDAFSPNVQEILMSSEKGLNFGEQINKMAKNDRLYSVVKAFSEIDMNPETIDNVKMGYIFEDLIRRFSENASAGEHYTGRDIIRLMVNILLAEGCDDLSDEGKVVTILDQACGTGGMLSTSYNSIKLYNSTAEIHLYGQENNPESYAMCLAEMLIKGQDAENIQYQDTMKKDCFPQTQMRFVIENPPFGESWGGKDAADGVEAAVKEEHKDENGRWPFGLPASGDMQMLFLQSAVHKMDERVGRAAIIQNASPLFSGGTASGESQIRRGLLDNDLIEAIIQLPNDIFYNTGIATYIWILSKNKRAERKGKIQLIDASGFCKLLRKSLGKKRYEITRADIERVTKLYADFENNEYSKIFDNDEFKYREYVVMQPLQRSYGFAPDRLEKLFSTGALIKLQMQLAGEAKMQLTALGKRVDDAELFDEKEKDIETLKATLCRQDAETLYMSPEEFEPVIAKILKPYSTDKKIIADFAEGLSKMDKRAKIQTDKKGNTLYDKETRDTEIVPFLENIDDYMAREVLPFVPDGRAFFEENLAAKKPVIKTGAEIPFTRTFYKFTPLEASKQIAARIAEREALMTEKLKTLFGDND